MSDRGLEQAQRFSVFSRLLHMPATRRETHEDGIGAYQRLDQLIWISFILIGLMLSLAQLHRLAQVDANGISLATSKPFTWDFTNLWYSGRLALEGRTEVLFDLERYRAGQREIFGPYVAGGEWCYPPTLLLIGAPLALLPLYGAYALWTVGTISLLSLLLRRAGLPLLGCALLWISPGALNNILFGQNGALTAFLLIGGLLSARDRPILAGLCFAALTIKPHLGLIVPACLIAAGAWRAISWSAFFALLLAAVTAVCFGSSVWIGFLGETRLLMHAIMEAPYGVGFHANAATVFILARWFGAGVDAAYLAQGMMALIAMFAAWKLWRAPEGDPLLRAAATAVLALLATPYGYSYDMVMLSAAVLILLQRGDLNRSIVLIPIWLWPVLIEDLNSHFIPLSPLMLIYAAALCTHAYFRSTSSRGSAGAPTDVFAFAGSQSEATKLQTQADASSAKRGR
jgi:hypothetical protein